MNLALGSLIVKVALPVLTLILITSQYYYQKIQVIHEKKRIYFSILVNISQKHSFLLQLNLKLVNHQDGVRVRVQEVQGEHGDGEWQGLGVDHEPGQVLSEAQAERDAGTVIYFI